MTYGGVVRGAAKVALLLAVVVLVAGPSAALASTDPFQTLSQTVTSNAAKWAGAVCLLGALVAGSMVVMGSQSAGRWVGRFFAGSVLLLLTQFGAGLLDWLGNATGFGQ